MGACHYPMASRRTASFSSSFSCVVIVLFPVFDFIRAKPADVLVLVGWIGWLTGFDALAALSAGAFRVFRLQSAFD